MPTIDQLAPATAASDADQLLVSQAGITRKISRAQVIAGLQPQLAVASGTLLGRSTSGNGGAEAITIGSNLNLSGGTLAATSSPFILSQLPAGTVPAATDLISISQGGTNVAITYSQFLNSFGRVSNVDVSQALVTPTGAVSSRKIADFASSTLSLNGGTLTGPLMLAGAPTAGPQAATKDYVDTLSSTALPKAGGSLSGPLMLGSDPAVSIQAATKNYVDTQVGSALPRSGGTLTGILGLAADPTGALHAVTKQYADGKVARTGDTLTGPLGLAAMPTAPLHAASKAYVDAQLQAGLPTAGGTLAGPLILSADPSWPLQATTKNYVDSQVSGSLSRGGGTLTGAIVLAGDPIGSLQPASKQYVDTRLIRSGDTLTGQLMLGGEPTVPLQAANKGYVDSQIATSLPRGGGTLSGPIVLSADPTASLQATTKQYVDSRILRSGDTLTGLLTLAADPSAALQAATKSYVDTAAAGALPRTGGTLTGALTLSSDPSVAPQAATKRYVDAQVATTLPLTGGTLSGALTVAAAPTLVAHVANKQYVDGQIAATLPSSGGSMTGGLLLAANPTADLQAATKRYVDTAIAATGVINVKSTPYGAQINGTTDDTAAFKAAYQAAASGGVIHVPSGTTVLQNPNSWNIPLSKPVKWVVDGTTLADGSSLSSAVPNGGNPAALTLPGVVEGYSLSGTEFSRASSQSTDLAVLHASYIVNHNGGTSTVISANRTDTIIYNSPNNYVWGGLDRLVWAGIQTPNSASAAQHAARYVQTIRQSLGTNSSGVALPQPQLWAACLEYRDATGKPSSWSNASLTVEMDWIGNGADDGQSRQVQSLVVAQHDRSGAPVEVSTIIGVYLGGGSSGKANRVFNVGIPFSTAVLDTTGSQQLAGAAAIRMAAGHSIAFEPTASCTLSYDSASGTLRWNQGTLSYPVGKGLSVGWANVCTSNTTLPSYLAGNIVFLLGSSAYTITLPPASSTPPGTGFTFSALGSGTVTIAPNGTDSIDNGPVLLRQSDRYHIVSDGSNTWREVFRTNSVSPRFSGPPVMPSYTVANLPGSPGAGAKAFVTNGRKPNEATGVGSGVEVFFDGSKWISVCSGSPVVA